MQDSRAVALQMCPFSAYLEERLKERFAVLRWFELGPAEQARWLQEHAPGVRAVVTGGHIGCPNELLEALPSLGIIAINGVGVDKVDLKLAHSRGVQVTTTPGVLTQDVADLAVGLIIGLLRGIPAGDGYVRSGNWKKGDRPLARKVSGRRFGIVGLGNIGSAIAVRLTAFGPVGYTGPHRKSAPYRFHADLHSLADASDVLVLACPANASTRGLIGGAVIEALGPHGYLVNVARGGLVDEAALVDALNAGKLAGAALDVFENEPDICESLRSCTNVVLTPHIGSATVETRMQMADSVLEGLASFC